MSINNGINWLEFRLNNGSWFRRGIAVATVYLTFKLTEWGMHFADKALTDKADLLGTAAIVTAIAGIPIGILTMLFTKYLESKPQDPNVPNQ